MLKKHSVELISKYLLTITIVLSPVLLLYSFLKLPITFFDIFSFFSVLFLLFIKNYYRDNNKPLFSFYKPIIPFLIYVVLIGLLGVLFDLSSVFRVIRYTFFLFIIAFFLRDSFCKKFAIQVIRYFSIFATIWLILQFVFAKVFHFYLTGFIPGLTLIDENLYRIASDVDSVSFRPRSFFQEPASYAVYIVFASFLEIKNSNLKLINILCFSFFGLGIVLSLSTLGIVCFAFLIIWKLVCFYRKTEKFKSKALIIFFFILSIVASVLFLLLTNYCNKLMSKLLSYNSFMARFSGYSSIFSFNSLFDFFQSIIGHGMTSNDIYLPGLARVLFYFGLPGYYLFLKGLKPMKKSFIFTLVFLILNVGSEIALGPFICLYFGLFLTIYCEEEKTYCQEHFLILDI